MATLATRVFCCHDSSSSNTSAVELAKQLGSRGVDVVWLDKEQKAIMASSAMVDAADKAQALVILASKQFIEAINKLPAGLADGKMLLPAAAHEFLYAMGRSKLASNFVCVALDDDAHKLCSRSSSTNTVFGMYLGRAPRVFHLSSSSSSSSDVQKIAAEIALVLKGPPPAPLLAFTQAPVDIANAAVAAAKPMPDGSLITVDTSAVGGHLKLLPSGIKIRQFGDGSTRQVNPNGVIIDTTADDTWVVQSNPDGTRHETHTQLKHVTSWLPDGTIMRDFGGGGGGPPHQFQRQDGAEGVSISKFTLYGGGGGAMVKVQTDWHSRMESTEYADGSVDQVDYSTGTKLKISKDGQITTC